MPPENLRAIHALWRGGAEASRAPMTVDEIREKAMADGEFYRQVRQWEIIGILFSYGNGEYGLNPEFAKDLEFTGFMEGL
jgi:hypothetical protein